MKAILMSIQSKWLAEILNGEKTVKLCKRLPKDYRGWVYLYCTKAKPYITQQSKSQFTIRESKDFTNLINGKVVGRVWVDNVEVTITLYWVFGKPKELKEFSVERYAEMPNGVFPCYEPITKAPQSWQYVEVEDDNSNETLRKEKQL